MGWAELSIHWPRTSRLKFYQKPNPQINSFHYSSNIAKIGGDPINATYHTKLMDKNNETSIALRNRMALI